MLTPHPLEAARLAGCSAAQIQAQRLHGAQQLAQRFACTVVLKGAGSIVAAPGQLPRINASGNARLATAGTGDVLAGMVGAALGARLQDTQDLRPAAFDAACWATAAHGLLADRWPIGHALSASRLAQADLR